MSDPQRRPGAAFLAELPSGYDERTRLALGLDSKIMATHPEHPPVYYDEKREEWAEIVAHHPV